MRKKELLKRIEVLEKKLKDIKSTAPKPKKTREASAPKKGWELPKCPIRIKCKSCGRFTPGYGVYFNNSKWWGQCSHCFKGEE